MNEGEHVRAKDSQKQRKQQALFERDAKQPAQNYQGQTSLLGFSKKRAPSFVQEV